MAIPTLSRTELAGLSHEELVERYFVLQDRAQHLPAGDGSAEGTPSFLSKTEQRFRDFAETSSHWFWEMGPDLHFTYISDGLTEFTGESPQDFLGKTRRELAGDDPINAEALCRNLEQMERREPFNDFIFERPTSTGGRAVLAISGKPVFDEQGDFLGYRGTARDLTEGVRAEEARRDREASFRGVFDLGLVGMAILSPSGRFVAVNKAYCDFVGYETGELTGRHFTRVIHPDDLEAVTDRLGALLMGEVKDYLHVRRYRHKQGHDVWGLAGLFALRNADGSPRGFVVQVQDITERKRTEEALHESEALLKNALEMADLGHWIWNELENRFEFCSEQLARMHGMTPEDYVRAYPNYEATLEKIHADDRAHYDRIISHAAEHRESYEVEFREIRTNGEIRHFRERGEPIVDDRGRLICTVGILQEITRQKAIEEELRQARDELTRRVEENTVELEVVDAQLRQAQKMEAIGQLTGGVAHDFGNLLAIILGNADRLSDEGTMNDQALDAITQAARRGVELTQGLLSFARRQPLRPRSISLCHLVKGMTELLGRTLGETIRIETRNAADLWAAKADPGQVESALLNLALNARHAMASGGTLTIETSNATLDADDVAGQAEVNAGDYVVLSVADTGHGIAPDVLERIYEPFFTTKDAGSGSGLGLTMVSGFVKRSGGHIEIDSETGKGTTIRLYLPRSRIDVELPEPDIDDEAPMGRGERIMVIEDDPGVRSLVVGMLVSLRYEVIKASNVSSAKTFLQAGPPVDALLCDVGLPGGISGPAFAAQMKRRHPGLKVLFMSGSPEAVCRQDPKMTGDETFIVKPFRKWELAQKLRLVFE